MSFLVGVLLLGFTSNPGPAQVNDTRAAAYASWSLGTQGSLSLPDTWPASRNYWGVEAPDGAVYVNRFPGVAYWAAPAYALVDAVGAPPSPGHPFLIDLRPAGWTAAVTVALAGVVAYALLRREIGQVGAGVAAAVLVFGTGLWSLAADALWPHGPAALWLLLGLWGWRRERWAVVAIASAAAVLVRPHLVVAVAVLGVVGAWWGRGRRWPVLVGFLGGGAVGLLALSTYTWAVFGRFAPTAGYDAGSHLGGLVERTPWSTLADLATSVAGLPRGLLLFTPVAAVALVAVVVERRSVPRWTVVAAIAGLAYVVVQVRAMGPLGGRDFFGPRTSLETLVLAAPLLAIAGWRWATRSRAGAACLVVAAVASVGINAYGAIARSISPAEVERWEEIDATVRAEFGDLSLGEVDLRELSR